MRNSEIAAALEELGILYELDGANRFRVLAYKDAAKTARSMPQSIEQMAREGRLVEVEGFGKTLQEKVLALLDTGEIPSATKLKKKMPASLVQVTRIPGVGAKTARRLYDELGVSNLDELKEAAEKEQIRELKGLGAKVEENVLASLAGMGEEGAPGRVLLSEVLPQAEEIVADLSKVKGTKKVEATGSVRRWGETCKDLDLVAASTDPEELVAALEAHPLVESTRSSGDAGTSVQLHTGISVDLRINEPKTFGNLLQHFTGSAAHNVELRERAQKRDLSISEHGVKNTKTGKVHECATEAQVYKLVGLPYIEPELREGHGEIAAADPTIKGTKLPKLVEIADIKGDLHSHTTLSDGKNTLAEMAAAARKRGYSYFANTDHSASHGFGDHVTDKMLEKRIKEIRAWNKGKKGFRILAGSEVNIGTKGELDYPEELLAELDWVIASVHTSFQISEAKMTGRVLEAIENPLVDCIGHLTGRMLLRREPYGIDVEKVAEAAARTGTMLEINGNPNRRDLSDRHARLAAEAGVMICVNTDAHRVDTLENMRYGIATARRAWLTPKQVANSRSWTEFKKLRKRAR